MSDKSPFFICKHCGNLATFILKKGGMIECGSEKMADIIPNTVDASVEKHKPVVTVSGESVTVEIGSVLHPMQDDHNIPFVYLETKRGNQCKYLKPGEEPKATFTLSNDKPIAVYAYCNLHGLWKTAI